MRDGEVAAWGEPDRADQTFSVAKTYLALLAGIAHARGLLEPHERVSDRLPGIGFDSPHNRAITWEHLLTQTSEWQGECFGMPDQVDHYRRVSHDPKPPRAGKASCGRCARQAATGNTTTCASTSSRWRCFTSSAAAAGSVPRRRSCGRSVRARTGSGKGTKMPGSKFQSGTRGAIRPRWHALGRRRVDQRARSGIHRPVVPRRWPTWRPPAPANRVGGADARPCAVAPFYGWLMWLNAMAAFRRCLERSGFMFGAGGQTSGSSPRMKRWSWCAGSTARTRRGSCAVVAHALGGRG